MRMRSQAADQEKEEKVQAKRCKSMFPFDQVLRSKRCDPYRKPLPLRRSLQAVAVAVFCSRCLPRSTAFMALEGKMSETPDETASSSSCRHGQRNAQGRCVNDNYVLGVAFLL